LPLQLHYKIKEDKKKKNVPLWNWTFCCNRGTKEYKFGKKVKGYGEAIDYNKKQSFLPSFILFFDRKGKNLVNKKPRMGTHPSKV
jgi:hypothetical protein